MNSVSTCDTMQPADHRDAQRLAQLGAGAGAERDRQRAHQRGKRRHHDRPEAQQAGLGRSPRRRRRPVAPQRQRHVDHHDGVLLDDADQHQQADHRDDREVEAEQPSAQQRADRRRRQAGQDGQRMDEALVEDAEHDVDRDDRAEDEQALVGERVLERLGGAGRRSSRPSAARRARS